MTESLAREFERHRKQLTAYACRLVVRPAVAEELVQTAFLRCLEASERLPDSEEGVRAWLFKVLTHLAFDELRRHSTWRETMMFDLREATEGNPELVERSIALIGSPETKAIAREHVVACLACTLRNLPDQKAAALLLREVQEFSVQEVAELLDASSAQVKNWLQEARALMQRKYSATCALIAKNGVCYQCVELDRFFGANRACELPGDDGHIEARIRHARDLREQPWGRWHRMIFELLDEIV